MSRIFLSHSSMDNAAAIALRDWLGEEGWDDVFLDVDPERGLAAGERWERGLHAAAQRCEAVLFLVSKAWLASQWCLKEFDLAHRLNKRLFGVLIDDIALADMPVNLTGTWQLVRLGAGRDHVMRRVVMPVTGAEVHVTFSAEGLARLRTGLRRAGLDARFFDWPPEHDPDRPPYRGLRPLEAEDAGIFYGREAPIIEALDRLRGLRDAAPPRLVVILGASGAGKSSFLRAGLLPRLARDDSNFVPLPVVRPERAAVAGESGFVRALEAACRSHGMARTRAAIRDAVAGGIETLRPLLTALVDTARPAPLPDQADEKPPLLVLPIDQGEELFLAEGGDQAAALLALLRDLLLSEAPNLLVLVTMRSDSYERMQTASALEGLRQETLSLPPMPHGAYQAVIEGPAARLKETPRALAIGPALTQALLVDIETGGSHDALPLLAFTLERLYLEYGASGRLTLADYEALGRIKGSIEAAVERVLLLADGEPAIPKDRIARLALLRLGLIPWLAGIDPETGEPRRRVARLSEIPDKARPLIQYFVEQRLLATDVNRETGEQTIEPSHEALLRQWGLLKGWLADDAGLLRILEGVKRASHDWAANGRTAGWLTHSGSRLDAAERLDDRPDLAGNLAPTDRDYLAACHKAQASVTGRRRLAQVLIYALLVGIIAGLVGWINQNVVMAQVRWMFKTRPFIHSQVRPYVLTPEAEHALKPGDIFTECSTGCPRMVVVPPGEFYMGSPANEANRGRDEAPIHKVTIARAFAVSTLEATFADWDLCVAYGECRPISDGGWGRGRQPVINISWYDAKQYVAWLSRVTGRDYRLLSEAEYEYAARAGTTTAYYWGNDLGVGHASCNGCGNPQWDGKQPSPAGSFAANKFKLQDMLGNVWEWVEDCYHDSYIGAPTDGSPWARDACPSRVARGGTWTGVAQAAFPRAALRDWRPPDAPNCGFRVARTLMP